MGSQRNLLLTAFFIGKNPKHHKSVLAHLHFYLADSGSKVHKAEYVYGLGSHLD